MQRSKVYVAVVGVTINNFAFATPRYLVVGENTNNGGKRKSQNHAIPKPTIDFRIRTACVNWEDKIEQIRHLHISHQRFVAVISLMINNFAFATPRYLVVGENSIAPEKIGAGCQLNQSCCLRMAEKPHRGYTSVENILMVATACRRYATCGK